MVELLSIFLFIHIFGGIAWYGEVFFITFVLIPTLGRLPTDAKGSLMVRIFPRIFNVATVTSTVTIVAGATTALLYSNFDFGIFLTSPWGLSILFGGAMGLFMYILHMTVEVFELRALKTVDLEKAEGFPEELTTLERRVRMLPRIGFVILTVTILLMIYAAHGI